MWTFPARSWSSSSPTTGCWLPRPAAVADGSPAARIATSRHWWRRGGTACRLSTPVDSDRPARRPRHGHAARRRSRRFGRVVMAAHSDQALRRCWLTRRDASTSCSAPDPLPTQRGGAFAPKNNTCSRAAVAPGRAERDSTCSTTPTGKPTVTYHMNHLQDAAGRSAEAPTVTLDAATRSTRTRSSAHDPLRASGLRRRARPRRPGAPRECSSKAHTLLRRLLGLDFA